MNRLPKYGNDVAHGHVCESVHEDASITNSPVSIEDNRTMNPDQRIINPVIINLHFHVNKQPDEGFINKIMRCLNGIIDKQGHVEIEGAERLSTSDIQGRIIRELGNG